MKKNCIAMLLAGGQGSRLYALTQKVAKPSVPFGGKYRIIDFPLSNCANSGIDTVGVLTQYRPLQLNSYIGSENEAALADSDDVILTQTLLLDMDTVHVHARLRAYVRDSPLAVGNVENSVIS